MMRTIDIQNPAGGGASSRSSDTPTLDVPSDFDRLKGFVSLDAKSQAHHVAADGKTHAYHAMTRPLSWRVFGEECLVADSTARTPTTHAGIYRLKAIKPPMR